MRENENFDMEEISFDEVIDKMFSGYDETTKILSKFGINANIVETNIKKDKKLK